MVCFPRYIILRRKSFLFSLLVKSLPKSIYVCRFQPLYCTHCYVSNFLFVCIKNPLQIISNTNKQNIFWSEKPRYFNLVYILKKSICNHTSSNKSPQLAYSGWRRADIIKISIMRQKRVGKNSITDYTPGENNILLLSLMAEGGDALVTLCIDSASLRCRRQII